MRFEIPPGGRLFKMAAAAAVEAQCAGERGDRASARLSHQPAVGRAPAVQSARSLYTAVRLAKGCSVELYERE